jgi:adenosylcobinamide-GDP ribazoletransferase
MHNFIAAIQFITILPVGKPGPFDPQKMIPFFPAVGILLGLLVAIFDRIALRLWNEPTAALLDVILLAVVTGAFHLDGLGDTADGLLGQRSRENALTIMKDSRIGTMGLVAVVFGLALKWSGIAGLGVNRGLLLVIIPAYARLGALFGIRHLEYGRPDGGTGLAFFNEKLRFSALWGLVLPVGLSLFLGWKALWLIFCFAIITSTILFYYKKRMGCITGDMLGAMIEISEAGLFVLASIGGI